MGVPKELPPGVKPKDYALLTMVAKDIAPSWADEDIFTI
jgi:uptake hydrogenase small subunit